MDNNNYMDLAHIFKKAVDFFEKTKQPLVIFKWGDHYDFCCSDMWKHIIGHHDAKYIGEIKNLNGDENAN